MVFQTTPNEVLFLNDSGGVEGRVHWTDPDKDGVVDIDTTYVSPSNRGLGMAGRLMGRAFANLKDAGSKVRPSCSYAKSWVDKHPEYQFMIES